MGLKAVQWCAWSLGILLLWAVPVQVQSAAIAAEVTQPSEAEVLNVKTQRREHPANVLRKLTTANVVYLGETHDSVTDHQAQLEIIRSLHQQNPRLAIAFEMFQRPYQSILDRYIAGEITETQLREQSQFDRRWGFPWEYYAPILQYAKAHQLPLLALNAPSEVSRKVARQGLASLTDEERAQIPPSTEIQTDNQAYRQLMRSIYDEIHSEMGNSQSFERFFLAQVLWDETMAERISQFLQANPQTQVVVLAGQGHIVYGYGIPSRVQRRLAPKNQSLRPFQQKLVLLNPSEEMQERKDLTIADYFWFF